MTKFLMSCLATVVAAGSLPLTIADEVSPAEKESKNQTSQRTEQRVEIRVNKTSTQKDDEEADTDVSGKIIIYGVDGKQEFDLGDKLPKEFPLRLKALNGSNGEVLLHADVEEDEVDSPARYVIGIQCAPILPDLAEEYDVATGALTAAAVIKGLPAAKAGIEAGDVVLEVDGKRLSGIKSLVDAVGASEGKELEILILRDGEETSFRVKPRKMKSAELRKAAGLGRPTSTSQPTWF